MAPLAHRVQPGQRPQGSLRVGGQLPATLLLAPPAGSQGNWVQLPVIHPFLVVHLAQEAKYLLRRQRVLIRSNLDHACLPIA